MTNSLQIYCWRTAISRPTCELLLRGSLLLMYFTMYVLLTYHLWNVDVRLYVPSQSLEPTAGSSPQSPSPPPHAQNAAHSLHNASPRSSCCGLPTTGLPWRSIRPSPLRFLLDGLIRAAVTLQHDMARAYNSLRSTHHEIMSLTCSQLLCHHCPVVGDLATVLQKNGAPPTVESYRHTTLKTCPRLSLEINREHVRCVGCPVSVLDVGPCSLDQVLHPPRRVLPSRDPLRSSRVCLQHDRHTNSAKILHQTDHSDPFTSSIHHDAMLCLSTGEDHGRLLLVAQCVMR